MRKRGFTIAEALVALVLISVVLGATAGLLREMNAVMAFSEETDIELQTVQQALSRIRSEAQQAVVMISPPGLADVSELTFEKVSPTIDRLTPPLAPGWTPHDAAAMIRVRYYLSGNDLFREVTPGGTPQRVASSLAGFTCKRLGNDNLEVRLSIQKERRLVVLPAEIHLPLRVTP